MNESTQGISPLRERMIEDMRMRKLSPKAQAYIRSVRQLAGYLRRAPDTATIEDLRNFQLHLVDHGTSPISLNAAITGLKFFFGITLDRGELMAKMQSVFVPRTLPVVLSREEVVRLIGAAGNLKHQTALSVAYGAGLRGAEVAALNVGDVDSSRMSLRIEQGKGAKDLYAMLAPVLLIRPLTLTSPFSVSSTLERTTSSTCPLSFSASTGSGPSAVGVSSSAGWRSALPGKTIRQNVSPRAVSWRFLRDTGLFYRPARDLILPSSHGHLTSTVTCIQG